MAQEGENDMRCRLGVDMCMQGPVALVALARTCSYGPPSFTPRAYPSKDILLLARNKKRHTASLSRQRVCRLVRGLRVPFTQVDFVNGIQSLFVQRDFKGSDVLLELQNR